MNYSKILLVFGAGALLTATLVFGVSFENGIKYQIIFFLISTLIWLINFNFRSRVVIKDEQDLKAKENIESKIRLFGEIWLLVASSVFSHYVDFGRAKHFVIFAMIFIFIGVIFDVKKIYFNNHRKTERDLLSLPTALLVFIFIALSLISFFLYHFHKNRGMFFEYNTEVFYFPLLLITSATALIFLLTFVRKMFSKSFRDPRK